jgi:cellulose synthase (UDP-forming)
LRNARERELASAAQLDVYKGTRVEMADQLEKSKTLLSQQSSHFTNVLPNAVSRLTVPVARFAIFFTVVAWLAYVVEQCIRLGGLGLTTATVVEALAYLATVTLLTMSCLAFMITRLGHYERIKVHQRVQRNKIDDSIEAHAPSITVLVPSYREEERTIRQTVLSAALQEYPDLKVVLLVDDPPYPTDPEDQATLAASRAVSEQLSRELSKPFTEFKGALAKFDLKTSGDTEVRMCPEMLLNLSKHYDSAVSWFEIERRKMSINDHVDRFFAVDVLERIAADLRMTGDALRFAAIEPDALLTVSRVRQLHLRLVNIFQAEISYFERKRFASLSHEPNKAMNLNSYIGLMGGRFSRIPSARGPVLKPTLAHVADLEIPDSDYLLTLDADSVLLPEYCLRLVYHMEQEGNKRIAVAQTPYISFPGAPGAIERIAGATTDIQHIVHQGMQRHEAAFWVGANAIIRKSALMELEARENENGFEIKRYISDRTVIEDTESSVGLRRLGWKIYNYPERLSYSATPPDFGTLVVQRQRWANGGLIILPKLLSVFWKKDNNQRRREKDKSQQRREKDKNQQRQEKDTNQQRQEKDTNQQRRQEDKNRHHISVLELFLRVSYLASIAWTSLCLCILFFYPFADGLLSRTAIVIALPYFIAMTLDLRWLGYRKRDIFGIYGFNLLLLPVNIIGTIESVVQMIGGHKLAFARTPKVANRTPAPLSLLWVVATFLVWSVWTLRNDVIDQDYLHMIFTVANLAMLSLGCVSFIGITNFFSDIFYNLKNFVYVPLRATAPVQQDDLPDWASVLYVGSSVPTGRVTNSEVAKSLPLKVATESTPSPLKRQA